MNILSFIGALEKNYEHMCNMSIPVESLDSSDDDDDIFVIKQIKPVNKLTLQQALIIKHGVLNSFTKKSSVASSKDSKKRKKGNNESKGKLKKPKKKNDKVNTLKEKEKKCEKTESDPEIVLELKPKSIQNPNKIVDQLKEMNKEVPEKQNRLEKRKSLELSSEIPESKRLLLIYEETKIRASKEEAIDNILEEEINAIKNEGVLENLFNESFDDKSQIKNLLSVIKASDNLDENNILNNSELVCFALKKIIRDETKKQMELESKSCQNGKTIEKLLSEKDCEILEKFFNLNENACKVYVRMLCRKKGWFQVSAINYKDIGENLQEEFRILHKENFVDVNIEDDDLKTQMDVLSKAEVLQLCKSFNVFSKSNNATKKEDLIHLLIENIKNQRSVFEVTNGKNKRIDKLKLELKKILGMCIKLNERVMSTFSKILFLFSFAHYNDEEDKRLRTQLNLCIRVFRNIEAFPNYVLSPTVIFETRNDFENYYSAVLLQDFLNTSIACKRHSDFMLAGKKAKEEFQRLSNDEEYKARFMNLPTFLRRYSAASVYARILTNYCNNFKKKNDNDEIIEILSSLLNQNLFSMSKKGKWYEVLSLTYEQVKNNEAAAEILLKALQDPSVDEVQKLTLQLRGQALLKRKTNSLTNQSLRTALDELCTISVQEPPSIEISGRALPGNETGYKCVYIEETKNEMLYISVEERAIRYYKSVGYTKGYHTEGSIIQTIYFLLFYDIIYGLSPPGVFQTPYQQAPLDFYSGSFYNSRKDLIDPYLDEMCKWTDEEIEMKLKSVYNENLNVSSLIVWDEKFTPEMYSEILKCMTMPVFVLICQRFIKNFKVARSGFPDLTLWNPETNTCKFVEVKSPNDRLSPGQRMWLDYLRNSGIDCEVCRVKNVSSKVKKMRND